MRPECLPFAQQLMTAPTPKGEQDAFADNADDIAADETRRKIELFAWADSVLGLNEADLELAARRRCETF